MDIIALSYISLSEIKKVRPDIDFEWIKNNTDEFYLMLYQLGMDTESPIDFQENIQHRNRFNEVVVCHRWVGNSRLDKEWISSGHASTAAVDKARRSKLLIDLYRMRGEAE